MPKLDLAAISATNYTNYPAPFDVPVQGRWSKRLALAGGLQSLGASHVVLKPGAWSAQRHWHSGEDELIVMLTGLAVLIEDGGRTTLGPGDIATFPADVANGHHIINEGTEDCSYLAVSAGPDKGGIYPDIDMLWNDQGCYLHKDGTPYPI
ncbi:cupin domain-containing protein [Novosphingobium terrae]|uniref:cupin domain-containing protein n=1 Tax=Novosphingobium terrae TaxID=2726189 RepID=UPI00197EF851|nr:cupin domain-containing protein [Novosphingobium terrae]